MPSNYPDTTYAGDPRAPWNEPERRICAECAYYVESPEDCGICARRYEGGNAVQAADCIVSDGGCCEDWEEA